MLADSDKLISVKPVLLIRLEEDDSWDINDAATSGLALGPTQPPVQRVTQGCSLRNTAEGAEVDCLRHLFSSLRMRKDLPPSPHFTAWCLGKEAPSLDALQL